MEFKNKKLKKEYSTHLSSYIYIKCYNFFGKKFCYKVINGKNSNCNLLLKLK